MRLAILMCVMLVCNSVTFARHRKLNILQAHVTKVDSIVNEVSPQFPGGTKAFDKFLRRNIKGYPEEAKKNKTEGRVFLQFVVEKDGSLTGLKVIREPGCGLGDEALRLMSLSPKWIPGMQNGKPVRVQYTQPINFTLPKPFF